MASWLAKSLPDQERRHLFAASTEEAVRARQVLMQTPSAAYILNPQGLLLLFLFLLLNRHLLPWSHLS